MYKHVVGILVLGMFAGCAFRFGENWTPAIWTVALVVFVVFALTLLNPKVALELIRKIPSMLSSIPSLFKKTEVKPDDSGDKK